jgi:hypothetical protein
MPFLDKTSPLALRWRAAPISRTRINTLALGARLPTMSVFRQYVDAGGLMSTGRTSGTSSGLLQTSAALANG